MTDLSFLFDVNYIAVIATSVIYFFIGSFWFSTLFGTMWSKELEKHNVVIKQPTSTELSIKMGITFLSNVVTSFGIAHLVNLTGSATAFSGLVLGAITSVAFVVTSVATMFTWESKSVRLFLIDVGYPVIGILVASVILSVWH